MLDIDDDVLPKCKSQRRHIAESTRASSVTGHESSKGRCELGINFTFVNHNYLSVNDKTG